MKKYSIHFSTYQTKLKTLPGFLVFLIILVIILLIPVLLCLALAVGITWTLTKAVLRIFIPASKNKAVDPVITIPVEEVKKKDRFIS
jgi:hypothetical protein